MGHQNSIINALMLSPGALISSHNQKHADNVSCLLIANGVNVSVNNCLYMLALQKIGNLLAELKKYID